MESIDIAWAAGLFEGEGSICIFEQKRHVLPLIRVGIIMTDRDVLERFCAIVGCGKVTGPHDFGSPKLDGSRPKPTFSWHIGNRKDVERIVLMFLPWLGERRTEKANEALMEIARLDRTCRSCDSAFRARRDDMHFCSIKCRNRWNYLNRRPTEPSKIGRPRVLT